MDFSGCLILLESGNKYYRMKPETLKLHFRGVCMHTHTLSVCMCAHACVCLPVPSPGDVPNPGIKPRSPVLQADSLPAEPQGKPQLGGAEIETDLSRDVQALVGVYEPSCRGRPPSPGDAGDLG